MALYASTPARGSGDADLVIAVLASLRTRQSSQAIIDGVLGGVGYPLAWLLSELSCGRPAELRQR